jgi:hypothetical protein
VSRENILRAAVITILMLGAGALAKVRGARRPSAADPLGEEMARAGERLRGFDAAQRTRADFAHLPTWDQLSGPEPYAVARVPSSPHLVGILRGDDALVVLDDDMHEVQRLAAPSSPTALALGDDGSLFVAGELDSTLARFTWLGRQLEPAGVWELDGIRAVRGLAAGASGWVYVAEEKGGRLIALRLERGAPAVRSAHHAAVDRIVQRQEMGACRGPIRASRFADRLIADCVTDHTLVIHRLESSGAPSAERPVVIRHDGPIWSFDAVTTGDGLLIAAGGVEDHPLDRTIGAFGYIDSFLFLYRIGASSDSAVREALVNISELGVVTPKAITLRQHPLAVTVTGYGSDKLVELSFGEGPSRPPAVHSEDFVPGATAVAFLDDGRLVFANPLLDAWIVTSRDRPPTVVPVAPASEGRASAPEVRLGEALFFTTLMAPFNRAEGALSRFTCETCHYEGYVDGRIHHTGRDDVHAVTKPLLGLFNNRPHFSRALDPDLTAVVFNEFRVAGAKSGRDPWFSLSPSDAPWVRWVGAPDTAFTPEAMRTALLRFLIAFQHRPNPDVLGRSSFSAGESQGAMVFRDHCEGCHEARTASDQPASRIPFERWEGLVLAREGAIVWAKDDYAQTGILPYVHEKGARVPSLRRLYKKHPYFTNGSAGSIEDVLLRARLLPNGFQHDRPGDDGRSRDEGRAAETMLDEAARSALSKFLGLL